MQHKPSTPISIRYCSVVAFLCIIFFSSAVTHAQDRCGTVEYTKKLRALKQVRESEAAFEQWMSRQIKARQAKTGGRIQAATYQIPVVVHVIHKGEAEGTGSNIPFAQIQSQINVLNKDYKRLNADASQTKPEFLPVAGSIDIEFVLAKRTPEGLATNGVVRVRGSQNTWVQNDNYQIKRQSYWPSDQYLNLWVCDITDYLGYAQFPTSSGLEGLEDASTNAETDGVVIAYGAFGSVDDGNFALKRQYDKGRTATHEIGHYLGLRHIWGDDQPNPCVASEHSGDYVLDTPVQEGSTTGCPSERMTCLKDPQNPTSGTKVMFQNYLDYTDDACMNLFTQGQVARMVTVLQNSDRRNSLLSSPALQDPLPVANDVGIRTVLSPTVGVCPGAVTPSIEVRNYGSNAATSVRIRLTVDGVARETKTFTLSLPTNPQDPPTVNLSFTAIPLGSGQHIFDFAILQTNGVTDGEARNNTATRTTLVPQTTTTPVLEDFTSYPSDWSILNPDSNITWEQATAPNGDDVNNTAMKMDFFSYENNLGEIDMLITPVIDLSNVPFALFKFDVAYAQYNDESTDGLRVVVLNSCNPDINAGTTIFDQSGANLATAPFATSAFVPQGKDQWKTIAYNLAGFVGQNNIQIALIGTNHFGNNVYVDNVRVLTEPYENLTIDKLVAPSPVTNRNKSVPQLQISNSGTDVTSFNVTYTVNSVTTTVNYSGEVVKFGETILLNLPEVTLPDGKNSISFELLAPNGGTDEDPTDNLINSTLIVDKATAPIPLRESFESALDGRWDIINPRLGKDWEMVHVNDGDAVYVNAFNNTVRNDESWLVSRVLNFSKLTKASLFFDLSYAVRTGRNDQLRVLGSTDGGNTFSHVLYSGSGTSLSAKVSAQSWKPSTEADWTRKYVSLGDLTGEGEVRLAFVFTNGNGNNLYVDNIELYLDDDPTPVKITSALAVYPNPNTDREVNVTVNLPELTEATLEVVNTMGKTIFTQNVGNLLNQTYPLTLPNATNGMYIVRLRTPAKVYATRLILAAP